VRSMRLFQEEGPKTSRCATFTRSHSKSAGSAWWKQSIAFCASTFWVSSIAALQSRHPSPAMPACPGVGKMGIAFFRSSTNGWWRRTTPRTSGSAYGRLENALARDHGRVSGAHLRTPGRRGQPRLWAAPTPAENSTLAKTNMGQ
jgi:hypothetical protein